MVRVQSDEFVAGAALLTLVVDDFSHDRSVHDGSR